MRLSRSTTTDAEGRFAFRNLSGGTYRVQVALMGYAPVVRELATGAGAQAEFVLRATPLTLGLSAPSPGRWGCVSPSPRRSPPR